LENKKMDELLYDATHYYDQELESVAKMTSSEV
jgi:hypothetical protein